MAAAALRTSLGFVAGTLCRYGLSLGHGMLTIVLGIAVYVSGGDDGGGPRAKTILDGCLLWGLVCAQACLLGFWIALAARPWHARAAYGAVHLLGLVFSVLAAGQFHLNPFWYDPYEFLRDVPAMFLSSFVAGVLLRCRGWKLIEANSDGELVTASSARRLQVPLGEFIKWLSFLCILLGLSVSLLPPRSLLLDERLWHWRLFHYAEFLLAVCIPAGFLASLIFLGMLARPASVVRILSMIAIWCVAIPLWIPGVVAGWNRLVAWYYLSQRVPRPRVPPQLLASLETIGYAFPSDPPWSLLALLLAIAFVAMTALFAGWHMRRRA